MVLRERLGVKAMTDSEVGHNDAVLRLLAWGWFRPANQR